MIRFASVSDGVMARPATRTVPPLAGINPATMEMMVVFPAPLGPSSP